MLFACVLTVPISYKAADPKGGKIGEAQKHQAISTSGSLFFVFFFDPLGSSQGSLAELGF